VSRADTATAPSPALAPALVVAALGAIAYADSFAGVFVFDDARHIVDNAGVHALWPLSRIFAAELNSTRPLVALTFALNYAVSGTSPWSYHLFNLLVHLATAVTLFLLAHLTLRHERVPPALREQALALALCIAALWVVHPLHVGAVTYITQRFESLMGLFYLLALYAFARRRLVASLVLGILAVLCKEVALTLPAVVLLYDTVFVSSSWQRALAARWKYYVSYGLPAAFVVVSHVAASGGRWAGFAHPTYSSWGYLCTQAVVLVHYLGAVFDPGLLAFDYFWPLVTDWRIIVPCGLAVLALLAATLWAALERPALGFLGAAFFVILAPTSSLMPVSETICDYRMYLPSMAVIALVVCGGASLLGRRGRYGALGAAVACLVLMGFTIRENSFFRSEDALWSEVVRRQPENARAQNNVATLVARRGERALALAGYRESIRLDPTYLLARQNLAPLLLEDKAYAEALVHLRAMLALGYPFPEEVYFNLGVALRGLGQQGEAEQSFSRAVRLNPELAPLVHERAAAEPQPKAVDSHP